MKYLKYFENAPAIGYRNIKVEVRKLTGLSRKVNGEEYDYTLLIDGKLFYYHSFPFTKGQDNFEILSDKNGIMSISIDKDTFNKNKGTVTRNYLSDKNNQW
jgi:hypothetical protein